jgi:hypothetical protein
MDNYNRFLPLGSVVKIKGKSTPVMIVQEHISPELDYIGVDHPFGFTEYKELCEFNISEIEEVYFIGYQNKNIRKQITKNNIEKIKEEAKKK